MASESKTAVVAALVGNAALAILKGMTAAMTGSAAMLAETCHSLADTGNQILLFVGMRLSQRPPDRARPFGYGMNTYFWSFVVSAMLFTLGGAFSIWEAVHKFIRPAENAASPAAFFVLAGAFVFEAMSLGVALHSVASQRRGMPAARPKAIAVSTYDTAITVVPASRAGWISQRKRKARSEAYNRMRVRGEAPGSPRAPWRSSKKMADASHELTPTDTRVLRKERCRRLAAIAMARPPHPSSAISWPRSGTISFPQAARRGFCASQSIRASSFRPVHGHRLSSRYRPRTSLCCS